MVSTVSAIRPVKNAPGTYANPGERTHHARKNGQRIDGGGTGEDYKTTKVKRKLTLGRIQCSTRVSCLALLWL